MSKENDPFLHDAAMQFAQRRAGASGSATRISAATVSSEGDVTRVRVTMAAPVSTYLARYNARTGECLGWFFELAMAGLDQGGVPESECLLAARAVAAVPEGAVLERCGFVDMGGLPVYEVVWRHEHDGLVVEDDAIVVRVNGRTGQPFSLQRRWHAVSEEPGER